LGEEHRLRVFENKSVEEDIWTRKGGPRRRWEDNIKMDLREIGIDWANWIQLAQDRVQ
jgi:hypothetical protein